jgi:hypothetical protein
MAQGPWDTGTWDSALWDSLPITGNAATGSPGSVGVGARTVALTGVQATGAVGTQTPSEDTALTGNAATGAAGSVTPSTTIALTGVQATGQVGTESSGTTIALTGVQAIGQVGTVSHGGISFDLTGVGATGTAGNVIYVPAPIIIVDDTHDGDYHKKLKKRFDKENQRLTRKRDDVIAAYERIVEGKPALAKELTAGFEVKAKSSKKTGKSLPSIDFDKLINDLDRTERLWNEYLEMEDEDLMVLL